MFVIWTTEAEDGLADVYTRLHLFEQRALVRTVQRIERELAGNPWYLGEEREPGTRYWFTGPLQIVFELIPGGGVKVVACGPNPPRRG
jgi:plasmid stabilization system protein ParE